MQAEAYSVELRFVVQFGTNINCTMINSVFSFKPNHILKWYLDSLLYYYVSNASTEAKYTQTK